MPMSGYITKNSTKTNKMYVKYKKNKKDAKNQKKKNFDFFLKIIKIYADVSKIQITYMKKGIL